MRKIKKIYCCPCILFSRESNVWSKTGCDGLNNYYNLKHKHETNRSRIESLLALKKFGNVRIEMPFSEVYKTNIENETIKNNRHVVCRLIDATCYLAKQELSFRAHNRRVTSTNRGNYLELIDLMGTLDLKLSAHLSTVPVFFWFFRTYTKQYCTIDFQCFNENDSVGN